MVTKKRDPQKEKDITLRDVLMHVQHTEQHMLHIEQNMQHMEQRLSAKIEANTKAIKENREEIRETRRVLSMRIDALDEDLVATINDTIKIRAHVGIPVSSE